MITILWKAEHELERDAVSAAANTDMDFIWIYKMNWTEFVVNVENFEVFIFLGMNFGCN